MLFNSHSLTRKIVRNSNSHQTRQYQSKLLSLRIEPKVVYDETWLSNKQYNARVTACVEKTPDNNNNSALSKRKSSRTCTYRVSNGQIVHERIYPARMKDKVCLRVAVNGASKSMRGLLPLSNLNLSNGDFGDDAGMFVENPDYCFVGK